MSGGILFLPDNFFRKPWIFYTGAKAGHPKHSWLHNNTFNGDFELCLQQQKP